MTSQQHLTRTNLNVQDHRTLLQTPARVPPKRHRHDTHSKIKLCQEVDARQGSVALAVSVLEAQSLALIRYSAARKALVSPGVTRLLRPVDGRFS